MYRTAHHNRNVSWLRRTEYISTEYNRSRTSNEMVETKYVKLLNPIKKLSENIIIIIIIIIIHVQSNFLFEKNGY